jgi:hypothetical protein
MKAIQKMVVALLLSPIAVLPADIIGVTNVSNLPPMTSVAAPPVQPVQIPPPPTVVTNGDEYPDSHLHEGIVSQQIDITANGCEATFGRHKVLFSPDIASSDPPVQMRLPDGRQLAFKPSFLVLANRVTGENLLIGQITNRIGEVIEPDYVLWTNAFDPSGPIADVEYHYTPNSLEQNIIFRQNPLSYLPSEWDLTDVSVEFWTEFFSDSQPPLIQSQTATLRTATADDPQVDVEDQNIDFGSMKIVAGGQAFRIGSEQDLFPVSKSYAQVADTPASRTFLIETLDAAAMENDFNTLPEGRHASNNIEPNSSRSELLRLHAANTKKSEQERAQIVRPKKFISMSRRATVRDRREFAAVNPGVVLDFSIVNTVPVPSGNVSWWPAGGNALDANANHNNGTLHGSTGYAAGKVGQAFNFTNSSSYVQISDAASLNPTNAFTIDAWVYFSSASSNFMIVGKDNQSSQRQFLLSVSSAGRFHPAVGITNGTFYYLDSATVVTQQTWYHVAMTYSAASSTLSLYVNGLLDTNATVSGSTIKSSEPIFIGNQPYSISYNGGLLVDEVDIFNRDLAASDIAAIYNAGSAGKVNPNCVAPSTNAIGWWAGDDVTFDIAHTNSGILYNGAAYASGEVSDAFTFDGSTSYLVVSNNPTAGDLNPTNALTLEAWVYLNSFDNWHHPIISKDGCYFDRQYLLTVNNLQTFRFHIGTACGFCYADGTNVVPVGAWTHVAMTYDSATQKLILYVNGVKDTEVSSIAGPIISTTQPVFIGGTPQSCFPYFFPGFIDEPTIYNRALTATEISAIYSAGCAGKCKVDTDSDGLTDLQEVWIGTNPNNADTDGDGVNDGVEFYQGGNPLVSGSTADTGNVIKLQVYTPLK